MTGRLPPVPCTDGPSDSRTVCQLCPLARGLPGRSGQLLWGGRVGAPRVLRDVWVPDTVGGSPAGVPYRAASLAFIRGWWFPLHRFWLWAFLEAGLVLHKKVPTATA